MHRSLSVWQMALFAGFAILLAIGCTGKKETAQLPQIDPKDLAPDFAIGFASGGPVRLSDLRGKAVILSFTLNYVDICHELQECLKKSYAMDIGHEAAFVEIDLDTTIAQPESIFVDKDSLYATIRDKGGIARAYKIKKIPTVVIIDKLGRPIFRHEGFNADVTCSSILRPQILKAKGKTDVL
jgi:cytochrome c biogenesis protein CcmG, thiol:disulfide interchange protein DsbE